MWVRRVRVDGGTDRQKKKKGKAAPNNKTIHVNRIKKKITVGQVVNLSVNYYNEEIPQKFEGNAKN